MTTHKIVHGLVARPVPSYFDRLAVQTHHLSLTGRITHLSVITTVLFSPLLLLLLLLFLNVD